MDEKKPAEAGFFNFGGESGNTTHSSQFPFRINTLPLIEPGFKEIEIGSRMLPPTIEPHSASAAHQISVR